VNRPALTRCAECVYWERKSPHRYTGRVSDEGTCRAHPPLVIADESVHLATRTIWPETKRWDSCGEGRYADDVETFREKVHQEMDEALDRSLDDSSSGAVDYVTAADYLGVATTTVRRLVNSGQLVSVRLGRRVVFRVADLDELLERGVHESIDTQTGQ